MRRIDLRFILISMGLAACLGAGAYLLHQIQVRRSAGILLEQGKQRLEAGQPGDALGFLTRYTTLAPQDADAQVLLADTLAKVRQPAAAIKWYEQALLRDASKQEARQELVELYISQRRFSDAATHLDSLSKSSPADVQVHYLLGLCHEGLGERTEAIANLREAIKLDPTHVDAYRALATMLREGQENVEEADALMIQLVDANPTVAQAYLTRADYRAKNQLDGVVDDVRRAEQIAPDDLQVMYQAAGALLHSALDAGQQEDLLDEAQRLLEKGKQLQPRYPAWYLGLAQANRSRGDLDAAISNLEEGSAAAPDDSDLQWNLADMLIQQDRVDEGLAIVSRLRDHGYPQPPLEYLAAMVDIRRMSFLEASKRLDGIRGRMNEWPELARQTEYWLGNCYDRLGEYSLELTAFRNAVRIDPHWTPARQSLANALARNGKLDDAIAEFQQMGRSSGVPQSVNRQLARLVVLRELQLPEEQRNWQPLLTKLDEAARLDPESPVYETLKSEIQELQEQTDAAKVTLEHAAERHPSSVMPLLALAALDQRAGHWDQAEQHIKTAWDKFGDTVEYRLAQLGYLVQRFGVQSYDRLRELEQRELVADKEQIQQWRTSLATAYFSLGKTDDAKRLWKDALEAEPYSIRLHVYLFDLALSEGDDAQMQAMLDNIQRIERSDEKPLWKYGEATRQLALARKGDSTALEAAERLLDEVHAAQPTWSRVPLLQAELAALRGDSNKTVELYLEAIDLGEQSTSTIRRAVELLYRQRRYADANRVLQRFEATQLPITGVLGRLAADVSFRVQDFSRAMQIADQVIGNSDEYEDLVWMAQLYSVMNQPAEAEKRFAAAIGKQPTTPDAWVAVVQHFIRTGHPERAQAAIDRLGNVVGKDAAPFLEASCRIALGDETGAQRNFVEASQKEDASVIVLKTSADFFLARGQSARGEPLLARILSHSDASPGDIAWARRNQAILWAASGGDDGTAKALNAIEQNLLAAPGSADDLRAKAICLEQSGKKEDVETALEIVDGLLNTQRTAPTDQLLAYRLCTALGRTSEARKHLEVHTLQNRSDPQNLVRYILFLLKNDDLHEAQTWITRLDQQCRDSLQKATAAQSAAAEAATFRRFLIVAAGLQAQLVIQQGNAAQAIQQITGRVAAENGSPEALSAADGSQLLMSLANQFATSIPDAADSLRAAAELLLKSGQSPRDTAALVAMLAQRDQLSEAVGVWTSKFDASAADEFAVVGAALAARSGITVAQLGVLSARLDELPTERRTKTVLISLSQIRAFQARHQDAIDALREVLAKDQNDAATMNNLACYLALSGGDTAEALELVKSAMEILGPSPSLLDSRGIILMEMNKPREALRDFEQSLAAAPDGSTYLHLAAAYSRLDDPNESAKMMTLARSAGLNIAGLHPLERARYQALLK